MKAPLPDHEIARLKALCQYNILDTPPEEAFDDFTALAAQICETPIALITLVDQHRLWVKSKLGINITQTPRDNSFCAHAILGKEVFIVQDTLADKRFAHHPLVIAEPHLRFYAGAPLITSQGYALGTLSVFDFTPRQLSSKQIGALQTLSRQIITQLELKKTLAELAQATQQSNQLEQKLHLRDRELLDFFENGTSSLHCVDANGIILWANQAELDLLGYTREEYVGFPIAEFHTDKAVIDDIMQRLSSNETLKNYEAKLRCKDGSIRHVLINSNVAWVDGKFSHTRCFTRDITEYKQAEKERLQLLQKELCTRNQITQILESITDAFYAIDNEWRFTYLNQQAERLLRKKRKELLGKNLWDEFPETLDSRFYSEYHRAITEQVSVEFETFYPPLNTWFWVHAYPGEQGLSVYFEDINDRKRAEAELLETTTLQRAILDSANYAIISTTPDGIIRTFNAAAERLVGYTAAEVVGKTTPILIHDPAEVVQRAVELTQELGILIEPGFESFVAKARLGTPDEREWTYIRKDGSRFPLLLSVTALRDHSGKITGFLGIGRDITERKRAQEELQLQNRRSQLFAEITLKIRQSLQLEEILQTTVTEVQKILQVDRVLLYRVWPNGTGCTVTEAVQPGWPEILGISFAEEVFPLEYQELYRQGQVRAIADVEQAYAEFTPCLLEFLQPWGVKAKLVVPILVSGDSELGGIEAQEDKGELLQFPIPNSPSPKLWGLLIAHHCTSPRQWTSFETELLQQLSQQIALALTQAQLLERETRQRLELAQSNDQLQEFAYVASHDLQEPLRKIQAFGDRLRFKYSEVLTDQGRDYLGRMQNAAERMQALIDDLLTLSRVTTRAQPFVTTNLMQVVQEVLSDLEVRIQQTDGRIELGELPTLQADPLQMRQLLQNLISNALKFHRDEEPPVIKIYSRQQKDQEWRPTEGINRTLACQICVEDNGIGFDEKYLDRIFNAFQRLHGRSEYEGTGMGLAICRKIVERHYGNITAQSIKGQGSKFIVTLPLSSKSNEV